MTKIERLKIKQEDQTEYRQSVNEALAARKPPSLDELQRLEGCTECITAHDLAEIWNHGKPKHKRRHVPDLRGAWSKRKTDTEPQLCLDHLLAWRQKMAWAGLSENGKQLWDGLHSGQPYQPPKPSTKTWLNFKNLRPWYDID